MELELLRHRLELALRVFRDTDQRLGSGEAVVAVCDFLGSLGIEPRLRVPLQSLVANMADDLTKDARKPLLRKFPLGKGRSRHRHTQGRRNGSQGRSEGGLESDRH